MLFSPSHRKNRGIQLQISERRLLLMAGDALSVTAAVLGALAIWSIPAREAFTLDFILPQSFWFFVLPTLWFILASANDFYELALAANRLASLQRLVFITAQLLVVYVLVYFFSEPNSLPRLFIVYYGVISFVLIALWRLLNPALIGWAGAPRRLLIVGTDWAAQSIIEVLRGEAAQSYEVMGIIGEKEEIGQMVAGTPVIGTGNDILGTILRDGILELVVTSMRELNGETFQGVMDAYERGASIVPMPLLYERLTGRVPVEHVNNNWTVVLPLGERSIFNPYPLLKRLIDIVISFLGLIVFIIVLPFIGLLIWLESPGNIFYTQLRVGLNGRIFPIIKFRTMIPNAEAKTGAVWAAENDPRITRIGRFLRKSRLDELPQLINVLKGDMSLVGPRPERPQFVRQLQEIIPFYRTRHIIRPGVTGWAQVRYRYGDTKEDAHIKLQYDLYYIRHQSLLLDLNIIIRTIGKVVNMAGQ